MIAIIDYGLGNLASVWRALQSLGQEAAVTTDPVAIGRADRAILPGVGAFAAGMHNLRTSGLDDATLDFIATGRPFLGICLGQQLLMEESEEGTPANPHPRGLGLFPGSARLLPGPSKVPQIGWNSLRLTGEHPWLAGAEGQYFYFVHSYYVEPRDPVLVAAETDYDLSFAAAIAKDNVLAVQFHPEKSGASGLRLLKAFCEAAL